MLIGIGPETGTNRELSSDDKPIDLHSVFPTYRWDSEYKDKLIHSSSVMTVHYHCNPLAVLVAVLK